MDFSVEKESRQGISNLSDRIQIVCAFPMNLPQGFSSVCNCADVLRALSPISPTLRIREN
jgi:hypothetical protein